MTVLGLGIDVVDIPGFTEQLADAASGFADHTFTAAELATAHSRPGPTATHLAGRFAAKEAFLKAWSSARLGQKPALRTVDLREIQVVGDDHQRPFLRLHGAVHEAVSQLIDPTPANLLLSVSHDGPVATAVVLFQRSAPSAAAPAATAPSDSPEETT